MLGLAPSEFYDMTLREFFNALRGKYDYDSEKLEADKRLALNTARFNASSIAHGLSEDLAEAIRDTRFDWEQSQKPKQKKKLTYGEMVKMFDSELAGK